MTQRTIWRDFPEINRSLGFQMTYVSTEGPFLGCHCGNVADIQVYFGISYYAAEMGKNIKVLDTTKEPQITYTMNRHDGMYHASKEEEKKVLSFLDKEDIEFGSEFYAAAVETFERLPIWIFTDVVNMGSRVRPGPVKYAGDPHLQKIRCLKTADFAKYLIDNKIGYVMESPLVQNPNHRTSMTYSMNQAWIWIPPEHLKRAVDTAAVHGEDQFPSKDDWSKTVRGDLFGQRIPSDMDVAEYVFSNKVFPETGRFHRRRGADGRFLPNPKLSEA